MSFQFSLAQLTQIISPIGSNVTNSSLTKLVTGISTDTRTLKEGDLFLALKGENFNGHEFVETAVAKGAVALVIDAQIAKNLNVPQFQVEDTLVAYQQIARWWRDRFLIPVIGITGSVGKTTTKELIAATLATQGQVLKTLANYNNEIGVPKTLLGLSKEDKFAVIEMAMRARGEIALLTQIARPTIGVITNVGTAHIGRLGSEQAIAEAKCELLAQMPDSSVAVLNHDNERLIKTAPQFWQGETLTYGLEGGDLCGQLIDAQTLRVEGIDFTLPLAGRHNASNFLAALAIAKILGIDFNNLQQGLAVNMPQGRSQRYQLANDILILDETYNAGLESMLAALQLLKETPGKRHLAILGTMKELGDRSREFHYQVGETVKKLDLDRLLVLVGDPESEAIALGAKNILTECFSAPEALVARLTEIVEPGDRLLFKASHSVGLNRVVEQFCSNYEQ